LIFAYFAAFLGRLSPHCQPLFYFLFFIFYFIFLGKNEFWGITQNWVMTVAPLFTMLTVESLVRDFR
jgi:hypothetical protein